MSSVSGRALPQKKYLSVNTCTSLNRVITDYLRGGHFYLTINSGDNKPRQAFGHSEILHTQNKNGQRTEYITNIGNIAVRLFR